MSRYKLSIITINFNNLSGLKRTVESVINQTYKDFEYIIIDGGSTDGSAEYVSEKQEQFAYWVSESDKGIYNAMNKGAKVASGEYLYFLNSGDCLLNNEVIGNVFKEIESENNIHNRQDVFLGSTQQLGFKELISPPEVVSLYYMFKSTLPHQGIFLPRVKVLKFPFREDYKIVSDWIQCVEVLREGVLDFKILQNTKTIAINEPFGTCSEDNVKIEKNKYIDENQHVFRRFEDYQSIRYRFDLFKEVKSANMLNRLLWRLMLGIAKKSKNLI
jgi:glycosyltransferase involved in cell wall biosynthesis